MSERKGSIKVNTSDIFPIIKKWLYSEHDIFLRELVANATDAITKRATLARVKNQELPSGKITITVDRPNKLLHITDNGIGMSEAEVEKYIAQLAFSGAAEFVEKLKQNGEEGEDIIGKFGLGFYSVFMVASEVKIESLSMNEGEKPTTWICKGDTEYEFKESNKSEVGTTITLSINEDNEEFLDSWKLSATLRKFCDFMPNAIEVIDLERKAENEKKIAEQADKKDLKEEDKVTPYEPTRINDTQPLWKKDPSTLQDEDYISFFHKLFPGEQAPLFWLHLRIDHPFTLEGILYFPKLNLNRMPNESNIKLYCKQVFVSDNTKNIVPDFLGLLKGVIDSSDIPLNVSRSSLQGDPNIKKISNYVVRKVAESLKKLFNNDRAKFESIWEDVGLFAKYGSISDNKFDELMRPYIIFKNTDEKYVTFEEYKNSIPNEFKEKMGDKVLYYDKEKSDGNLKRQLQANNVPAVEVNEMIDPHYMQHVEVHKQGELTIKFASIDGEIGSLLDTESTNEDDIKIKELFENLLSKGQDTDSANPLQGDLSVEVEKIKNAPHAAYIKVDESMKRMANMFKTMGQNQNFPLKKTLVINPTHPLVKNAMKIHEEGKNPELVKDLCQHVEDLAHISASGFKNEERELFVTRSQKLIEELLSYKNA